MSVLPIVERELRVAARRGGTYWMRLAVALGAIVVGGVVFLATLGVPGTLLGRYIFQGLAGLLFLYCLAYGRRSTADCLSREKRDGTLGLLFLTDLKGHDVVLGKLTATSLNGFYGLLAVLPVLSVPLLMGGVSSGQFWRMAIVLVDTFFLSLAIGLLGSALCRNLRHAMAANFLLLLLVVAFPPACAAVIGYFSPSSRMIRELFFSCPAYSFYLSGDGPYALARTDFWCSVGLLHGLTWLLVLLAAWVVPRSWQDRPVRAAKTSRREFGQAWIYGDAAKGNAFRKRSLDVNAFYWLSARARLKPAHVWTFLIGMAGWWVVGWITSRVYWFDVAVIVVATLLLNCTLKIWVAIEAGQQLAEDQANGAFELLLSTPLTVREILRGQLLALRRQFLGPLLAVLLVEWMFMRSSPGNLPRAETRAIWGGGMVMLVADLVALSWVGMSSALTAKSHNHASVRTVGRLLILPWTLFCAVLAGGHLWFELVLGQEWSPTWKFYVTLWLGLGFAADLLFGFTAWWQLRHHFRELALQRFESVPKRFAAWFGRRVSNRGPAVKRTDGKDASAPKSGAASGQCGTAPTAACPDGESRLGRLKEGTPNHPAGEKAGSTLVLGLRRRRMVLACLGLFFLCCTLYLLKPRQAIGPVTSVNLDRSNAPLRVFPGNGQVFLILPDGSLWRWGLTGAAEPARSRAAMQVGTNCDWVQAVAAFNHCVGLRSDGTIWEWGMWPGSSGRADPGIPKQTVPGNDWASIAASPLHTVALRRDGTLWAWGDNSLNQLGNGLGPGPGSMNLVQVGTNSDWAAVACHRFSTLALRRNGTLWTWGEVQIFGAAQFSLANIAVPTQVCRETNWAELASGPRPLIRTSSGEVWEQFDGPPSETATAASTCRLMLTNSLSGHFAAAFTGQPKLYDLRTDGTLWEQTYAWRPTGATSADKWRRTGNRSDWVAIWGSSGTALGLTSDGTLWAWGVDPSRPSVPDLRSRLTTLQARVRGLFSGGPRPRISPTSGISTYERQPRPLLRLVSTNSAAVD